MAVALQQSREASSEPLSGSRISVPILQLVWIALWIRAIYLLDEES
jgi:hypothetical protein